MPLAISHGAEGDRRYALERPQKGHGVDAFTHAGVELALALIPAFGNDILSTRYFSVSDWRSMCVPPLH